MNTFRNCHIRSSLWKPDQYTKTGLLDNLERPVVTSVLPRNHPLAFQLFQGKPDPLLVAEIMDFLSTIPFPLLYANRSGMQDSTHPVIATPAHGKCASVDVPHIVSDSENGLFERYDTLGAGNSTYSNTDVSKVKS